MSTPDEYRRRSQDCLREAEAAKDALMKESWLGLAKSWSLLADQTEKGLFSQGRESGTTTRQ
jgi:hypothetical protein